MNHIRDDQRDAALKAIRDTQGHRSSMPLRKYSDDQPRDDHGRFGEGGGGDGHGGSDPSGHGSSGAQADVNPDPHSGSIQDYNSQLSAYGQRMSGKNTDDLKAEHDKLQSKLDSYSSGGRNGIGSNNSSRANLVATRDKRDEVRTILSGRGVDMPVLGSKFGS